MISSKSGIPKNKPPLLVVVMGVSGTGKTTLATEIASHFNITFLDADSLHSEGAINQMSQGIALSDKQRKPWIHRICNYLTQLESAGNSCVLAYSGLKRQHRRQVYNSYQQVVGVILEGNKKLIEQRLQAREGHFISPKLLSSQIASMEPFNDKEEIEVLHLLAEKTIEILLTESSSFILQNFNQKTSRL